MNLFAVDRDPVVAAQSLFDVHTTKGTLESAQILCTVASKLGFQTPYKPTHHNHPCVLWAGYSWHNWTWVLDHGLALAREYSLRFGGMHKSTEVFKWAWYLRLNLPKTGLTEFVQVMPEQFRLADPVEAYRNYYLNGKRHLAHWSSPSKPPIWWTEATPNVTDTGGQLRGT